MLCNRSRLLLGGVVFSGTAAYGYSRNRNYDLEKRVENAGAIVSANQFSSAGLNDNSIYSIDDAPEKKWQEKLKINLMYAHEALQYTVGALPHGAVNYRDDLQNISLESIMKMDRMRKETELALKLDLKPHHNFDKYHEIIADIAKKYQMGNCGEQTAVAYLFLKNDKRLQRVEKLSLVNGDHGFVVIGRDPLSDITKPETWGKAAVVCDLWGKRYFPAEQLFDQLNKISERTLYDPNVHTIGWSSFGEIPPEVTIFRRLRFHQRSDKRQFAERLIADAAERETISVTDRMIRSCLLEYIERKSNPKVPPLLSVNDRLKVESSWLEYLRETDNNQ